MKRSMVRRLARSAIKRTGFGLVAATVLALSCLLPVRTARAEAETEGTPLLILVVQSAEETLADQPEVTPCPEETVPPQETVESAPTPEAEQADCVPPAEPCDAAPAAEPALPESGVEQTAEEPVQTEASGLNFANEYLFYTDDGVYAAEICGRYGGALLRWSDGVGVMYSATLPSGGDVVFYPQEVYSVQSIPFREQQGEAVSRIGAAQSLAIGAGKGVVIAVIDSGIDLDHPALEGSILQAISVIPSSAYGADGYFSAAYEGAQDYAGHGSHIAGIIAGQTDEATIGVAPEAQILSIKALEKYGASAAGTTEWLIRAVQYAIAQKVDIINLSIGGSKSYVSAAQTVFQQAADAGILVVCATGNTDGGSATADSIDYPAAYGDTLAVSCVTVEGDDVSLSAFSKYGEGTDLSAPGTAIYSCNQNGGYTVLSGTSMSCAVVSGVAGLLLSQKPSLTAQDLIRLLEQSSFDAGAAGYDIRFGWGVVDAKAALLLLRGQSGGHRHPAAPNASPSAGAALPAPQGAETTAADDWLTTQQEPDKPQAESLSEGEAAQNAGENSKKRFESSWIWAFVGGALCLGGAAWMLILRPKHRGS